VEAILGLHRVAGGLRIEPHIPRRWTGFEATLRTEGGVLEIVVDNTQGWRGDAVEIVVEGTRIPGNLVDLPTNGATQRVMVRMGAREDDESESEA
jgi:cellobiose phosphorylase